MITKTEICVRKTSMDLSLDILLWESHWENSPDWPRFVNSEYVSQVELERDELKGKLEAFEKLNNEMLEEMKVIECHFLPIHKGEYYHTQMKALKEISK